MNKKRNNKVFYAAWLIIGTVLLTAFDQWTKYLAVIYLNGQDAISLIPGVLELQYLENHGAAFGLLQNQQWLFYVMTVVMTAVIVWLYFKLPRTKKYLPGHLIGVVLLAGAFGNFIDRIRFRYVVDFIYFRLIDFPIFNVADIYVTVSAAVIFILVLFVYKDADYNFLQKEKESETHKDEI